MDPPQVAPFGTWISPITAEFAGKISAALDDVLVDPVDGTIYHIEKRPTEAGRNVVVHTASGKDVFGPCWNARSGVHEYGGASATVHHGIVYFSNYGDGRVYRVDRNKGSTDGEPMPITPENPNHRFANFAVHPTQSHLIAAILEDHTRPAPADVVNSLVLFNTLHCTVHPLVSGADFYAAPAFSPDGRRLAWIQWNHPDMPWEGAELYVANALVEDENDTNAASIKLEGAAKIKGKWKEESAVQPHWVDSHTLLFSCDESAIQNPWIVKLSSVNSGTRLQPCPVLSSPLDLEFVQPLWVLGASSFAILDDGKNKVVLATALRDGCSVLLLLDFENGAYTELNTPFVVITDLRPAGSRSAVFLGGSKDAPRAAVLLSLNYDDSSGANTYSSKPAVSFKILRGGDVESGADNALSIPKDYLSNPQSLHLTNRLGESLHVVFYPPANPDFTGPRSARPPCIIHAHGGPTGIVLQSLYISQQFFTSRGFAWANVNYGGSAGFGRKYVERLVGKWGIVDVNDCIDAALALGVAHIDPRFVFINGGSAGGYTTLQALCTVSSPPVFTGGASSYGVSDLKLLTLDTHKFESHYLFKLVGGTPEEIPEVYTTRSPVFNAERIEAPLLILQGTIDKVVPPSQAEDMVRVIRVRDSPGKVEYKLFEGEGHGWRKAETIIAALNAELEFYLDILGVGARAKG